MASKTEAQECKAMCRKLRIVSFVFGPAILFKSIGCIQFISPTETRDKKGDVSRDQHVSKEDMKEQQKNGWQDLMY